VQLVAPPRNGCVVRGERMKSRVFAAIAVVALIGSACSSTKSDSTSGSTVPKPSGSRTTTGVTDTQIKVSALGYKASYGDALVGAQARFKRENDQGGVYGRKIVLSDWNDDNQTPAKDTQVAQKVVEQDQPFAVVPVMTATFPAADYLDRQGVPYVGWGIVPDWCHKNAGFSLTGCIDTAANKTVINFGPAAQKIFSDGTVKGKAIALIGADNDSAKIGLKSFADIWTYDGAKVVYRSNAIPLPPTVVADYTPYAQAIMSSNDGKGPDLVEAVSGLTDGAGIAKKLRELGYKNKILEFSLYDPRIAPVSKDVYNEITFAAWEQTDTPAVATMIKDVDAIDPKAAKGLPLAAGYWSADLFISLLKAAGKDLTREKFIAAGNDNYSYDGQGGTSDLRYPRDHTEASASIGIVLGDGSGYTVTQPLTAMPRITRAALDKKVAAEEGK
jgi:ABC-type branched-subunit amino acid transport system substrate-binding protein